MSREASEEDEPLQYGEELAGKGPIAFDWGLRWLKGHEYMHILNNMERYCAEFGFQAYGYKTHPIQIYEAPQNGVIYFVKGQGVGSDFGFPRVATKKKYRWKKMNFTTHLPKKHSKVTYVVASAMRAHPIEDNEDAEYRMHAVVPYDQSAESPSEYILCHVRKVDHRRDQVQQDLSSCFVGIRVDFYKLFSYLHNLETK